MKRDRARSDAARAGGVSGRVAGVSHDDSWQASVAEDLADWDERFRAKHGRVESAEPSDGLWERVGEAMSLYTMFHAFPKERYK